MENRQDKRNMDDFWSMRLTQATVTSTDYTPYTNGKIITIEGNKNEDEKKDTKIKGTSKGT